MAETKGRENGRRRMLLALFSPLALAIAALAEPQPALPMRPGVYVPIAIGVDEPCLRTQLDIAVVWDGHQLIGLDREIIGVKLLKRAVFLPGYTQPGPQYLVRTKSPGLGGVEDEKWTFAGTDTVVLNADPILWCAKSLAELKRLRGEKP